MSWQHGSSVSLAPWLAELYSLILRQCDTPALTPTSLCGAKPPSLHISRYDVVAAIIRCRHRRVEEGWPASSARSSCRAAPRHGPLAPGGQSPLLAREMLLGSKSISFRSPFFCSAASAVG